METPQSRAGSEIQQSRSGVESPQTGRSSVVEGLLREEFLPVVPAEDETPYEKVVNELVATECSFVVNLRNVLEVYYWPLRNLLRGPDIAVMPPDLATAFQDFSEPILTADEIAKLYGCLEQLFPVNAGLLKDLQKAQQIPKESNRQPNPDSLYNNIGKLFNRFVHFLKMYSVYCCAYETSATLLAELLTAEKYAKFQQFCDIAMKLPRMGGATLASFLIQPVQRVPRYILMFKELIKHAPTSNHVVHETLRKELQEALKEATSVAQKINDEVRARKNRDEIIALSALFWEEPHFIGPSRRLIRQAPLIRECRGGNKPFTFFLFNDILAYAEKLVVGKYKLHRKIPIDESFHINTDLEEYRSAGYKQTVFAIEVSSLQKTFRVFFPNDQQKIEWIEDIEDQMDEMKVQIARKRTIDSPLPPSTEKAVRMLPHTPESTCAGCATTFSLLRPAVNCSLCGQIFCKKCTKTQVTLNVAKRGTTGEAQNEKEQVKSRSCEPCAQKRLEATRERLRTKSQQSRTLGWSGLYQAMGVDHKQESGTHFGTVLNYVPRTDIEKQLSAENPRIRAMTDPTHKEQDAPPLEPADGTSVYDSAPQDDLLNRRGRANRLKPQQLNVFEQLQDTADKLSILQKDGRGLSSPSSLRRTPEPTLRKTSGPPPPPQTTETTSDSFSVLRIDSPESTPKSPSKSFVAKKAVTIPKPTTLGSPKMAIEEPAKLKPTITPTKVATESKVQEIHAPKPVEKTASDDLQPKRATCDNCHKPVADSKFCSGCGHKIAHGVAAPKYATIGGKAHSKSTDILATSRSHSTEPRATTLTSPNASSRTPSKGPTTRDSSKGPATRDSSAAGDLLSKPVNRVRAVDTNCSKCRTPRSGDKQFCNACGHKFA